MAHIGRATNNPDLFWYNDRIGMVILVDIFHHLDKSPMDDNQLWIHPEEREKAKKLFSEYGFHI